MANRVSSRRLVGRDHELELLLGLVRRAGEGDVRAALVVGEPGIGKSRLVSEFAGRAREYGALVLVGECVDLAEAELPYAPIVGALRPVVRERSGPTWPGFSARPAASWRGCCPSSATQARASRARSGRPGCSSFCSGFSAALARSGRSRS